MTYGPEHWRCRIGYVKPRGNVHLFPGTVAPDLPRPQQPADRIIVLLQELIAKAMTGHLRAIAVASVQEDRFTNFEWACAPGSYTTHPLSAAIADLSFAYAEQRAQNARQHTQMPGGKE